jgi:hypothetical protein
LQEERAVLTVVHATTKKTILYPVLFPIPPDIVNFTVTGESTDNHMEVEGEEQTKVQETEAKNKEAIRALWAKVKIADYTQLRYFFTRASSCWSSSHC